MKRLGILGHAGARCVLLIAAAVVVMSLSATNALGAAGNPPQDASPGTINSLRNVSGKIDRALLDQFQKGKQARALILFREQADLQGADALPTKQAKGEFVYRALREVADRTQAQVRSDLDKGGVSYRAFYIANAIAVEGLDAKMATAFAAESSVERIAADPTVRLDEPAPKAAAKASANGIEWGIQKIGADKLWAKGIRGAGIVVANQDTGVDWEHPALKNRYRGYRTKAGTVDHSYNWWDAIHSSIAGGSNPCGYNSAEPCDDYGHGTHTMGTLVGNAGDNKIGVAPRAKWISCRNMDQGVGRPSTYLECFEFFLAPWDSSGKNPDPDRAPDVVSNSWGCLLGGPPGGEGCEPSSLRQATRALRAAGIFVAMSAGNSGSDCSTITDPAAIYDASLTVGATTSADKLAAFSSRGPVTSDSSGRRKPDISAPGVDVRSSLPGGGYGTASGTSMAAPHVAGAVALIWQARPNLRGFVGETEQALFNSAFRNVEVAGDPTCGGTDKRTIPNNLFGYGRLDVWKAYKKTK